MTQQTIKISVTTVSVGTFGIDETPLKAEATYDVEQNAILSILSCSEEDSPGSILGQLVDTLADVTDPEAPLMLPVDFGADEENEEEEQSSILETAVKFVIQFTRNDMTNSYEAKNGNELKQVIDTLKGLLPSNILEAHEDGYVFPTTPRSGSQTPILDLIRENSTSLAVGLGTVAVLTTVAATVLRNNKA